MLIQSDYSEAYYTGGHEAGYPHYKRRFLKKGADSLGEVFKDFAKKILDTYSLGPNTKVLEIGCAHGFVVESLRELGIDCYGIDWSSYAIGQATTEVAPYVSQANALTDLSSYKKNEFDVVFSLGFLNCVGDSDLGGLITEVNRIAKFAQFHAVDLDDGTLADDAGTWYNYKTLTEWIAEGWESGTIISDLQLKNSVTK